MKCDDCLKECKYKKGYISPCDYCKHKDELSSSKVCGECVAGKCQFKEV